MEKRELYLFCQDLIAKKGVMLLPATIYDYAYPKVRIGLGRKNFAEALIKLEEYLSIP